MEHVTIEERSEQDEFALKAAEWFAEHPGGHTFTLGDVKPECLLGIRWGLGGDCVVVVRLHEYATVLNYTNIIKQG